MGTNFYTNVIKEEIEAFDVKDQSLKAGARLLLDYNNKKCLGKNSPLIYNLPQIRCAYLYRYACINTGLVTKYFRKMAGKKEVKALLQFKKNIRICSLGGGPGIDIVGVFKALSVSPSFHKKISKASVLDISEDWENSFNTVMSGLVDGKADVPATFINKNEFKTELVKVDLLGSLTSDVEEIISSADIVCMIRFVSAIAGDKRSKHALKVFGNLFKVGALILYIDICNEKIFELAENFSENIGLKTAFGPFHEKFVRLAKTNKEVYDCVPQNAAKFSIVGWIKTAVISNGMINLTDENYSVSSFNDDLDWDTESEDLNVSLITSDSDLEKEQFSNEPFIYPHFDKYTQTGSNDFLDTYENTICNENTSNQVEELPALLEALSDLLLVLEKRRKQKTVKQPYCYRCQ